MEPCEKKKNFDYKYEEYSFWSHVKGNDDNNRAYFCEDEEISLKEQCAYGKLPHYDKSLREYFKESGENSPKRNDDAISCNEIISDKFYDHFYPKQTGWRPPWHPYSGDLARLPLSFRFNRESGVGDCFVLKTYLVAMHQLLKVYYPVSLVHLPVKVDDKELEQSHFARKPPLPTRLWAKIPREDMQYLFNLDKIISAKTIVICTAIEDAWALQNENRKSDVVFTSFKCDEGRFDQVDFSMLEGKNVVLLISNNNGNSLAEEYLDVEKLVSHLESKKGLNLSSISFIQREIVYPSHDGVWSYPDLLSIYNEQRPIIKECSLLEYNREQFNDYLKLAKEEIARKDASTVDLPFYLPKTRETEESNAHQEIKDTYDRMIIRPVLYEGTITVLSALAKTGKSRFALKLCNLFVAKNSRESAITGMAIKKCYREHESEKSAVYLAYDPNLSERIDSIKKTDFDNSELFIPIKVKELSKLPKRNADALIEKNKEKSVYKSNGKPIPVGIIVIDSVKQFSEQDKNDIVVSSVSNKLIEAFPQAAIMWLHHLNKEGKAGGGDEFVGIATINIYFKRYDDYSNSNKKFHYNLVESNQPFSNEDAEANICQTEDGDFIVVDPERTEDEMIEKTYIYYTRKVKGKKLMDADKAARLLGYKDASGIRHVKQNNKKSSS